MQDTKISGELVTVVLNRYKRPEALKEQYEAYKNQSIGKPNFMIWCNNTNSSRYFNIEPPVELQNEQMAVCSQNEGVWARFAYALNAKTPFVCVADDDTIPGENWLKNCFETTAKIGKTCILTTRGIKINTDDYPMPNSYTPIGWCNNNKKIEKVDFGGHCWFFPKNLLRYYWMGAPDVLPLNYGEDMHLSHTGWRCGGIETYVPPHPEDDHSLWGSLKETACQYGEDKNATSRSAEANAGMNKYWSWVKANDYTLVKDRKATEDEPTTKEIVSEGSEEIVQQTEV